MEQGGSSLAEQQGERRYNIDLLRAEKDADGLVEALGSGNGLTRQRAALALGDLGGPGAVEPLIRALGDPMTAVREAAADSLTMLGSAAVGPLVELLESPEASGRYEEPGAPGGAATVIGPGGRTWEVETRREIRRVYAAAILGEVGDPDAVQPLVRALGDASDDLRCQASGALAKLGNEVIGPLTEVLTGSDPEQRIVAAGVLGDTGDPAVVEPLINLLRDGNPDVRGAAGGALFRIGDAAVEPLIAATKDADRNVRLYAAGALKYIGNPRAIDALKDLARSGDAEEKSVAEDAMEKIRMVRGKAAPEPSAPTSR
ncbi:HEAT repeat domain-containing protein [Methanoculleus caldifontis]|uniref:HEAT repeat domain-containing protein n=1 Tax=Methanoculleus caldifontis TaxID=2651577 RepID=UPI00293747D5|nr:HEAT repeat domain-containing protein [Methanoculleus sp. Wushi-C6]